MAVVDVLLLRFTTLSVFVIRMFSTFMRVDLCLSTSIHNMAAFNCSVSVMAVLNYIAYGYYFTSHVTPTNSYAVFVTTVHSFYFALP